MAYSYTAEREYNLTVMKGFIAFFAIILFIIWWFIFREKPDDDTNTRNY